MRRYTMFLPIVCLLFCFVVDAHADMRYFTQSPNAYASDTPYGNNGNAGMYVQSSDARIYYETYGSGRPLLILHGGGVGSPYELGRMLDILRKDFRLIVISTRGHGRSEIGHSPISFEQKVQDVMAVLQKECADPVSILGFSDGAYTAYALAAQHPDRVERIAAIGAGTLKPGYYSPNIAVKDLEAIDQAYITQVRQLMPEPERLQEFLSSYMTFWSKTEVGSAMLNALKCPVLLLAGDEDDHAPIVSVLEAHQIIPNSRLCIVPKAWHTAFLDNWEVTWAAVAQFLYADIKKLTPSKKLTQNSPQ